MTARIPTPQPRPALFVLRDGVLCERAAQPPTCWNEHAFLAGALDGLRLLSRLDHPVILLAGTTGIAGPAEAPANVVAQRAAAEPQYALRAALRARALRVDAVRSYPAPSAEDRLHGRSALPRVLARAARLYDIDLATSIVICDTWAEAAAALHAGCQPILVMTGAGREQMMLPQPAALRARTWYAADLAMAALTAEATLARPSSAQTVA